MFIYIIILLLSTNVFVVLLLLCVIHYGDLWYDDDVIWCWCDNDVLYIMMWYMMLFVLSDTCDILWCDLHHYWCDMYEVWRDIWYIMCCVMKCMILCMMLLCVVVMKCVIIYCYYIQLIDDLDDADECYWCDVKCYTMKWWWCLTICYSISCIIIVFYDYNVIPLMWSMLLLMINYILMLWSPWWCVLCWNDVCDDVIIICYVIVIFAVMSCDVMCDEEITVMLCDVIVLCCLMQCSWNDIYEIVWCIPFDDDSLYYYVIQLELYDIIWYVWCYSDVNYIIYCDVH